jgi:hypothetical protein
MSVIMTLRTKGDAAELERRAKANPGALSDIIEAATRHGLIAHRFYGTDDEIMVCDEWPDPPSFQRFFDEMSSTIEPLMKEVGAQGPPEVTFWRQLDTGDEVGWNS